MTAIVAMRRRIGLVRCNSGAVIERASATFCPETAVRCDSPLRRKRRHLLGLVGVVSDDQPAGERGVITASADVATVISPRTQLDRDVQSTSVTRSPSTS